MAWHATLYSLLSIGGAIGALGLVRVARRHRTEPAATAFIALSLAIAAWSVAYGIQVGFTDKPTQLVFQRVVLAIAGTVPPLWVLFVMQFTGTDEWLTRPRATAFAAEPVVFAAAVLTNDHHGWIWHRSVLASHGSVAVLDLSFGVGYLIHITYAYALVAVGLGLLVVVFGRAWSLYRKQAGLLVAGALPPFFAHISYTLGVQWWGSSGLDFTPLAFTVTVVALGLALYRFDLLDRIPLARERMIAETGDGLVVLDADGTVVDANAVARRALDPPPAPGQPLRALDPGDESPSLDAVDGTTLAASGGANSRVYDISVSALTGRHGEVAGYAMILRDVTDRHAYEQRLEVANRMLRHNLRNDTNKIIGFAQLVEEADPEKRHDAVRRIVETAYGLVDLSEKADLMVSTGDVEDVDAEPVDAVETVESVLSDFRRGHSNVRFERECPDEAWTELPDGSLLSVALTNLVENAVEHNDARDPRVTVVVESGAESDDGRARIRVLDNGPGIPTMERAVIESGSETPLQHGSGVGLWLVHWSVETAGGEVTFDTPASGGTAVTITLPATTPPTATDGRGASRPRRSSETTPTRSG